MVVKLLFWLSLSSLLYIYIGYPTLLFLISLFTKKRKEPKEYAPKAVMIFAVHNEEKIIEEKLRNCVSLNYPMDKLQIVVVSDASTDRTDDTARSFMKKYKNIKLFRTPKRTGMVGALKWGAERIKEGIIIKTDASSIIEPDALRKLLRHFVDKKVGCVGGIIIYVNVAESGISKGQGVYWQYETFIKRLTSKIGYLSSVGGAMYAVRNFLFGISNPYFTDDDISPLNALEKKYKVLLESEAKANECAPITPYGNLRRQIRTTTRGIWSIAAKRKLLNPFYYPFVAFDLFSHRILRWCSPIFLLIFLIASIFLSKLVFYRVFLLFQILIYLSALIGLWLEKLKKKIQPFNFFFYASIMNLASLIAIFNFLRGKKIAFWEPIGAK